MPIPSDTVRLSTTRTSRPSAATARAASSALCIVADSAPESVTTRMPWRRARRDGGTPPRSGRATVPRSTAAPATPRSAPRTRPSSAPRGRRAPRRRSGWSVARPRCPMLGEVVGQVAGAVGHDARSSWLGDAIGAAGGRDRWHGGGRLGRRRTALASAASGDTAVPTLTGLSTSPMRRPADPAPAAEVPVPPRDQHEQGAAGDELAEAGEGVHPRREHERGLDRQGEPTGVSTSMLDRGRAVGARLDLDLDLGDAVRGQRRGRRRRWGTWASPSVGWTTTREVLVAVVGEVEAQRRAERPVSVNVNGLGVATQSYTACGLGRDAGQRGVDLGVVEVGGERAGRGRRSTPRPATGRASIEPAPSASTPHDVDARHAIRQVGAGARRQLHDLGSGRRGPPGRRSPPGAPSGWPAGCRAWWPRRCRARRAARDPGPRRRARRARRCDGARHRARVRVTRSSAMIATAPSVPLIPCGCGLVGVEPAARRVHDHGRAASNRRRGRGAERQRRVVVAGDAALEPVVARPGPKTSRSVPERLPQERRRGRAERRDGQPAGALRRGVGQRLAEHVLTAAELLGERRRRDRPRPRRRGRGRVGRRGEHLGVRERRCARASEGGPSSWATTVGRELHRERPVEGGGGCGDPLDGASGPGHRAGRGVRPGIGDAGDDGDPERLVAGGVRRARAARRTCGATATTSPSTARSTVSG